MSTLVATRPAASPTDRLLTASLVVGPLLYLAADTVSAARGWDDASAGVLQVLASIVYGLALLAVAGWLPSSSWLRAGVVLTTLVGVSGSVAYGFDTIHMSLGDAQLVDQPGAANLIKPLGLFFPLALLLAGIALDRLGARWQAALIAVAALAWPVGHIANIAWLCVLTNVLLVLGFAALPWAGLRTTD